jgi:hypothetical protein
MLITLPQGLLDRLHSTGAPSDPKTSGKPTGAKSPVKAPAKAAAQPEAVANPDAPAGPPPADLIVAARLHMSQVYPHTLFNLSPVSAALLINRCACFVYVHAKSATAFVLKTYEVVVGLWQW